MKKKTREFIVDKDEGIRADTTLEGLAKLKPVFAAGDGNRQQLITNIRWSRIRSGYVRAHGQPT